MDMLARVDSVGQTSISGWLRCLVLSPCSSHQPLQQDGSLAQVGVCTVGSLVQAVGLEIR